MPFARGQSALRFLCAVAAGVLALAALSAAAADRETEEALELDQAIQVLKDEALQFDRDAQLSEEEYAYPPHTRVTVYVSVEVQALLMKKLVVDIDGADTVTYEYSDLDAKALLRSKGLQRLGRFNVSKGGHRLSAQFIGRYADAEEGEADIVDRIESVFDKKYAPVDLELVVAKANRGAKPMLILREWRPEK